MSFKYVNREPQAESAPAPEPSSTVFSDDDPQVTMAEIEAQNREDIRQRNAALYAKQDAEQRAAAQAAEQARIAAEQKAAVDAEAARLAAIPRLPNGEEQLPLDTVLSHKHSVTQLRDLAQRQREAARSGPRAHGWRGTKF